MARNTWFTDSAVRCGRVVARFVIGAADRACVSSAMDSTSADIVLVDTPDCSMWHSAQKVHAWMKLALTMFPSTPWLAKTEDDALLWPTSILVDLAALSEGTLYYGPMHWQGSCRSRGTPTLDCSGCYGGALIHGAMICRPSLCRASKAPSAERCCQVGCPKATRMTPFAMGALDVRHRRLASAVASCPYADAFFATLASHSRALDAMCMTTDGAQGHVLGEVGSQGRPRALAL